MGPPSGSLRTHRNRPDAEPASTGKPLPVLGQQLSAELSGCDVARIARVETLRPIILQAAEACGATVCGRVFHQFSPHGVTGVVAIAESHISVHTWPENAYVALDLFTCSPLFDVRAAVDLVARGVGARRVHVERLARGPR